MSLVSVITPSLNALSFLKRCCASIDDQGAGIVEHLVVDGGSTDDTVAWLQAQTGRQWASGSDEGMYDALNKGFARARGEILCYLNCDEQFLPGAVKLVSEFFAQHPKVDILFAGALIVDPDGALVSYRKAYPMRWCYLAVDHLYLLSCATFWRRRIWGDGLRFDSRFRMAGDWDFMLRALAAGCRTGWLSTYVSAFTATGRNLSNSDRAGIEYEAVRHQAPTWLRVLRPVLTLSRRCEKWIHGGYDQKWPLEYDLYGAKLEQGRIRFEAKSGSFRWKL